MILALAIAQTLVWAAVFYVFPAMLLEWERTQTWSKTELSGAFTAALVAAAVLSPVSGRLIDRGYGLAVLAGSAAAGAVLLVALSAVRELWQFYVVWLGLGVIMSGALYDPCFAIVTKCLGGDARRVITRITLIAGFAGTLSIPAAYILNDMGSWRSTLLIFAGVVMFAAVPLAWWGCSQLPTLGRDGTKEEHAPGPLNAAAPTVHSVTRSPAFWLLAFVFGVMALEHSALLTHILPLLDERGVGANIAVAAAAGIGPMQVVGRLVMMAGEKHMSVFASLLAGYSAIAVGCVCLLFAGNAVAFIALFVLLQGAGWGITSIARPLIIAEFLGRRNFGAISGLLAVPMMLGNAAAPSLSALIWVFSGYDGVIMVALFLSVCGVTALAAVSRHRRRQAAA